jgi:hypothetical protein
MKDRIKKEGAVAPSFFLENSKSLPEKMIQLFNGWINNAQLF